MVQVELDTSAAVVCELQKRLDTTTAAAVTAATDLETLQVELAAGKANAAELVANCARAEAAAAEAGAAHVAAAGRVTSLEHQLGSMAELHERECQRLAKTTEVVQQRVEQSVMSSPCPHAYRVVLAEC
jgi:chromosome segregation ATPase